MKKFLLFSVLTFITILLLADSSYAALSTNNILNDVLARYKTAATSWAGVIQNYAEYFFGGLAVMGFVWQISQAYFHRPDFAGVFGEIIRYVTFVESFYGFFEMALL